MHPYIVLTDSIVIPTYSLLVTLSIIIAVIMAFYECRRYKIPLEYFPAGAFWTVLGGIIGGRVFDIIFYQWDHFMRSPWEVIARSGGWMYYGAEIGGAIGLILYLIAIRIDFRRPVDICGMVLLLAHAIGRLGCYYSGCCYGTETDSWAATMFPGLHAAVHPTQLYESIPLFIGFAVFWIFRRRFIFPGTVYATYMIFYGMLRFIVEFYRDDAYALGFLRLSPSQHISLAMFAGGILLWRYALGRFEPQRV